MVRCTFTSTSKLICVFWVEVGLGEAAVWRPTGDLVQQVVDEVDDGGSNRVKCGVSGGVGGGDDGDGVTGWSR